MYIYISIIYIYDSVLLSDKVTQISQLFNRFKGGSEIVWPKPNVYCVGFINITSVGITCTHDTTLCNNSHGSLPRSQMTKKDAG